MHGTKDKVSLELARFNMIAPIKEETAFLMFFMVTVYCFLIPLCVVPGFSLFNIYLSDLIFIYLHLFSLVLFVYS